MAALMGGALIAIVVAAVTLIYGWATESEALVWTSIVSSVLAGVMIGFGYGRTRAMARAIRSQGRRR